LTSKQVLLDKLTSEYLNMVLVIKEKQDFVYMLISFVYM